MANSSASESSEYSGEGGNIGTIVLGRLEEGRVKTKYVKRKRA